MLYYIAAACLVAWFILKFGMAKGGSIHILLLAAVGCFVVQFVQHLRTRQYERERRL
jgi:uncharacterized protein DUF5670